MKNYTLVIDVAGHKIHLPFKAEDLGNDAYAVGDALCQKLGIDGNYCYTELTDE